MELICNIDCDIHSSSFLEIDFEISLKFSNLFQHIYANLENLETLLTWKWPLRGQKVVTS